MCVENQTEVTEFFLPGLRNLQKLNYLLFVLFLMVYLIILSGNTLILMAVHFSSRLHSPMYFFLCNLAACELLLSTVIMPNMLYVVFRGGGTITLCSCLIQFYLYASSGSAECLILTVMAFDRYLAVSNPLRYSSVMDDKACNLLAMWSWLFGFIIMSILTSDVFSLPFCGAGVIEHLFCDLGPILRVASKDTSKIELEALVIAFILTLFPFALIIVSYVSIFFTILKIPTESGRQKTFSTCSSHLASVCLYFGTLFVIYLAPSSQSSIRISKILSLLYIVVTPLLNPFIYSLRNEPIKCFFSSSFSLFILKKTKTPLKRTVISLEP